MTVTVTGQVPHVIETGQDRRQPLQDRDSDRDRTGQALQVIETETGQDRRRK